MECSQSNIDIPNSLYQEILNVARMNGKSVFSCQQGGDHYKNMPAGYQPFEISKALSLSPAEHTVLKYLLRHKRKGGKQDLLKAIHAIDVILEQEYRMIGGHNAA